MKCLFLFASLFLLSKCCYCQYNLVPNYSFEDSVICPYENPLVSDSLPKPWYIPSNFQDGYYYNGCSTLFNASVPNNTVYGYPNFQYAKTGNGYGGFDAINPPDNRSYLQIKLKDSLLLNHCYYCEFWISTPNPNNKASNNIAMWLTKTAIYSDTIANPFGNDLIPGNPQIFNYSNPIITDTINWVKVSSIYVAQGGEKFTTIGNFKNDINTVVKIISTGGTNIISYLVDDVSVIPLDSIQLKADAGKDTTIALNDSVFIGSLTNGLTNIKWYNAAGQVIDTARPGFYVKPTANTFYVLEQTVCGYNSRDTITVTVNPLPLKLLNFTVYAINQKEVKLQWQTASEENVSHFNVQRGISSSDFTGIGKVMAVGNSSSKQTYFYSDKLFPFNQSLYYRLQMTDKDGKFSYSKIDLVNFYSLNEISIFPNPVKDILRISHSSLSKQSETIMITDAQGRVLKQHNITTQQPETSLTINTSSLSKGMYLLIINGKERKVVKFLKD